MMIYIIHCEKLDAREKYFHENPTPLLHTHTHTHTRTCPCLHPSKWLWTSVHISDVHDLFVFRERDLEHTSTSPYTSNANSAGNIVTIPLEDLELRNKTIYLPCWIITTPQAGNRNKPNTRQFFSRANTVLPVAFWSTATGSRSGEFPCGMGIQNGHMSCVTQSES